MHKLIDLRQKKFFAQENFPECKRLVKLERPLNCIGETDAIVVHLKVSLSLQGTLFPKGTNSPRIFLNTSLCYLTLFSVLVCKMGVACLVSMTECNLFN